MEDSIDIKQLFSVLKSHLLPIAVSAVICGAAGFSAAKFLVPKQYESSAMLYVENNQNKTETLNVNDITAAQKLVNTCQIIFQSNKMLDSVIYEPALPYTKEELSGMISVTSVNSTEVMRITASNEDPQLSADIVNVLVELARDEFMRVIKSGSIEVVEYGEVPENPSFPRPMIFCAAGVILGAAAAYKKTVAEMEENNKKLRALKQRFLKEISAFPFIKINGGKGENFLPSIVNLRIDGAANDAALSLMDLRGVAASAGAACVGGDVMPSKTLLAAGLSEEQANCSFRVSFGKQNTEEQIVRAAKIIGEIGKTLTQSGAER